jgi:hypothetical protein
MNERRFIRESHSSLGLSYRHALPLHARKHRGVGPGGLLADLEAVVTPRGRHVIGSRVPGYHYDPEARCRHSVIRTPPLRWDTSDPGRDQRAG